MKSAKKPAVIAIIAIAIFVLLFVPLAVGGAAESVYGLIGFEVTGTPPGELKPSITISTNRTLKLVVHQNTVIKQIDIESTVELVSIKATLKTTGQTDIILGTGNNTTLAQFSNSYSDSDGNQTDNEFTLTSWLDPDTLEYLSSFSGSWVEFDIKVKEKSTISVNIR